MSDAVAIDERQASEEWLAAALGLDGCAGLFPWQKEVLHSFPIDGIRRYSVDVPTGLGKTSVMGIWLIARASGRSVPRRLVYVVDRRTVVDQATSEAMRLRAWLDEEPRIKAALGLGERPLPVSTLRGQFLDNREWLEDPSLPAIVVGTVDMIGSRLLFEGYRASRKMRPYHAGLIGVDCLLVLDEAHLAPPFERLLERIAVKAEDFSAASALPPFVLMSLSATGRQADGTGHCYALTPADLIHDVARKRLAASKSLRFVPLDDPNRLADTLAERAWELAAGANGARRCLVYCHRRETAQRVHDAIRARTTDVEMLVGARRVFERERAAERIERMGFIAGKKPPRNTPAFLIATSAGEVGIDLDADDMVADLVPWERMVQRLGRVNRRGEGRSVIEVVAVSESPVGSSSEEAAGGVAAGPYTAPFSHLPAAGEGVDVSPQALMEIRRRGDLRDCLREASTPAPLHPELHRSHLEAWAMTSLPEHTGRPKIDPWLRGWVDVDPPQCSVVWRRWLPIPEVGGADRKVVEDFFEAAPIHPLELLETESYRVADWLIARARALKRTGAAADRIVAVVLDAQGTPHGSDWHWTIGRLCEGGKTREHLGRHLVGSTLVVDAIVGGLEAGLLDPAKADSPPTLDDEVGFGFELDYRVHFCTAASPPPADGWKEAYRFVVQCDADGDPEIWLLVENRPSSSTTEDARGIARKVQELMEHQRCAESHARRLGEAAAPAHARILALAARLHDEGKRARRWQLAFRAPSGDGVIYAKTKGPINVSLLGGYRHEFGSLAYALQDAEVLALPPDERDLVLHLIASHHGFARPLISADGCEDAPPSALETRRREVAQRFFRLQARWGPWGLAWLEALLRAADQQASRDNDGRVS